MLLQLLEPLLFGRVVIIRDGLRKGLILTETEENTLCVDASAALFEGTAINLSRGHVVSVLRLHCDRVPVPVLVWHVLVAELICRELHSPWGLEGAIGIEHYHFPLLVDLARVLIRITQAERRLELEIDIGDRALLGGIRLNVPDRVPGILDGGSPDHLRREGIVSDCQGARHTEVAPTRLIGLRQRLRQDLSALRGVFVLGFDHRGHLDAYPEAPATQATRAV
mmetsp:Transcript_104350/g.233089  ORF Transcript_104350/g.233089 Transcript_104350/m.233089 type:complete len:224 (-) Transcript_104350:52-723(-)